MDDSQIEVIDSPAQIVKILQKAAVEEQTVEVQINQRTRIYFSGLMDHLPDPIVTTKPTGEEVMEEPRYVAWAYLFQKDHLLLYPLHPALGNAQIRGSEDVLIRFFDGVKSYEATLFFTGTVFVRGEPAIALTFPLNFNLFRRRRFFRADLPVNIDLQLQVAVGAEPPKPARLLNISPGGLAFCGDMPSEEMEPGTVVKVMLSGGEVPELVVQGIVRSHARTAPKDGCPQYPHRYGVQFDLVSEQMARRIEEVTAVAQRHHLRRTLAIRARMEQIDKSQEDPKPPPNRDQKVEELKKFFGIKKTFNFK